MVLNKRVQRSYIEIQKQLFYMIPEKWSKVFLYSSILDHSNKLETGELYFYYIPKGVLRKNPVNVYEVPKRFNIDENQYLKLVDKLYKEIKRLQKICVEDGEEKWNSIVISIADFKFNVEYTYNNKTFWDFNSYDKHIIFRYKYLGYDLSSFSREEKNTINRYIEIIKKEKLRKKVYSEAMYELPYEVIGVNNKSGGNIHYVKDEMIEELETEEKEIKSQILKSGY